MLLIFSSIYFCPQDFKYIYIKNYYKDIWRGCYFIAKLLDLYTVWTSSLWCIYNWALLFSFIFWQMQMTHLSKKAYPEKQKYEEG